MKQIVLAISLFITSWAYAAQFPAPYLNQSSHIQNLIFEGWSGSYLESTYVTYNDTLYFVYCYPDEGSPHAFGKICDRINRVLIQRGDLDFYQSKLLKEMKALREREAKRLDEHFFSRLLGGSKADKNILALDQFISAIEGENLKFLTLIGPDRPEREALTSPQFMKKLMKIWQKILNEKPPKHGPNTPIALI